jgi:hypothetical protein
MQPRHFVVDDRDPYTVVAAGNVTMSQGLLLDGLNIWLVDDQAARDLSLGRADFKVVEPLVAIDQG